MQSGQHDIPERCTLALLDLLPSVDCVSPQQSLRIKSSIEGKAVLHELQQYAHFCPFLPDPFKVAMDRLKFESTDYQRVYQYLRRHIENTDLDQFSYANRVEGTSANWLKIILQ